MLCLFVLKGSDWGKMHICKKAVKTGNADQNLTSLNTAAHQRESFLMGNWCVPARLVVTLAPKLHLTYLLSNKLGFQWAHSEVVLVIYYFLGPFRSQPLLRYTEVITSPSVFSLVEDKLFKLHCGDSRNLLTRILRGHSCNIPIKYFL